MLLKVKTRKRINKKIDEAERERCDEFFYIKPMRKNNSTRKSCCDERDLNLRRVIPHLMNIGQRVSP